MARRQPKSRDAKSRLLAAAAEVFGAKGYESTSVDDIVQRAGTTRGSFYYYFADKADIARDLQEELWGAIARKAEAALDPDAEFLTNVRNALHAHLLAVESLGNERLLLRGALVDPTLAMFEGEGKDRGFAVVRALVVDAMDKGQICRLDPDVATGLLIDALQEATLYLLDGQEPTPSLEVIDGVLENLPSA